MFDSGKYESMTLYLRDIALVTGAALTGRLRQYEQYRTAEL